MTIFLVENNSLTGARLQDLLIQSGHKVEWAINGNCVRVKLPVQNPDLIILDYFLGDIDGLSLLEEVRMDPRIEKIPVILTTAAGDIDLPSYLPNNVHLLRKPFEYSELEKKIEEMAPLCAACKADSFEFKTKTIRERQYA